MKNSFKRTLYHWIVCHSQKIKSFRGGWMLTHLFIQDYKTKRASYWKIAQIHKKGWSYNDWALLGITNANKQQYLSTREYCSLHPFNGTYSSWIDDKLILKYILACTKADKYMPAYYFQIIANGKVVPLMDAEECYRNGEIEDIANCLKEKKGLAFKQIKGSLGVGFYKAIYKNEDDTYWLNDEGYNRQEFIHKISSLSGYLITELLLPHSEFAKYCSQSVGCLRYILGRTQDRKLQEIYSFMRFGTEKSKFVENFNAGGVLVIVNNSCYNGGYILDFESYKKKAIVVHPDNNIPLKGCIPHWEEVVKAAKTIAEVMPQMEYMGIDFCITHQDKVKIIEINSLTSLDSFQLDKSIFETQGGFFFKERLKCN